MTKELSIKIGKSRKSRRVAVSRKSRKAASRKSRRVKVSVSRKSRKAASRKSRRVKVSVSRKSRKAASRKSRRVQPVLTQVEIDQLLARHRLAKDLESNMKNLNRKKKQDILKKSKRKFDLDDTLYSLTNIEEGPMSRIRDFLGDVELSELERKPELRIYKSEVQKLQDKALKSCYKCNKAKRQLRILKRKKSEIMANYNPNGLYGNNMDDVD